MPGFHRQPRRIKSDLPFKKKMRPINDRGSANSMSASRVRKTANNGESILDNSYKVLLSHYPNPKTRPNNFSVKNTKTHTTVSILIGCSRMA